MNSSLCSLLLVALLAAPAAEARNGGGRAAGARMPFPAAMPFPTTPVGIARQAALLSRLRALQARDDRIAVSQGAVGVTGVVAPNSSDQLGLAGENRARVRPAARMHVIVVTPNEIMRGQIQIVRGVSVETVQIR
jgi:hypothetical protein